MARAPGRTALDGPHGSGRCRRGGIEMLRIADMKYRTSLVLITGAAVFGIAVVAAASFHTLNQVRIGSDVYEQIMGNKDLIVDLCPANLSLNEFAKYYLSIEDHQGDQAALQTALAQLKAAEQDFEKAHDSYKSRVHSAKLREALDGPLYTV